MIEHEQHNSNIYILQASSRHRGGENYAKRKAVCLSVLPICDNNQQGVSAYKKYRLAESPVV